MNNTLTLYIPNSSSVEIREIQSLYEYRMARRFGGSTTVQGLGHWINGEGEMEQEPVLMITSYFGHGEMMAAHVMIEQFRHDLIKAGEEAVMVVLNGEATIV